MSSYMQLPAIKIPNEHFHFLKVLDNLSRHILIQIYKIEMSMIAHHK